MAASASKNRQEAWRETLQSFASTPPEEMGDKWGQFMKALGLTYNYYLAVREVLEQGRWVTAKYPRAYVKRAAMIEARKMHLVETPKNDTLECGGKPLRFEGSFLGCDEESDPAQIAASKRAERAQIEAEAQDAAESDAEQRAEEAYYTKPHLPDDWYIRHDPSAEDMQDAEDFNNSLQPRYTLEPIS
jgi:hypothetical protein